MMLLLMDRGVQEDPEAFLEPLSRPLTNPTRPPPVYVARVLGQIAAVALYELAAEPALFPKFYDVGSCPS